MASARFGSDRDIALVSDALGETDVTRLALWSDLDALSTHTTVEGVEVPVEGIIVHPNGRFTAIMNLFLSLQYGKDDDEGFTTSDSFLAKVTGRLEDGQAIIEGSTVDTSSFHE